MKKHIILDTDIGADSDDVGALMLLHNLSKKGRATIGAITSCSSRRDGAAAVDIVNTHYGAHPPLGMSRVPYADAPHYGMYSRAMCWCYDSIYKTQYAPDAVEVLRRALTESVDKSVTLVTIGPLNNIAHLLMSQGDSISPLDGKTLADKKLAEAYIMGGDFSPGAAAEWNIKEDIQSAKFAVENLTCQIVFSPFETGARVLTGREALVGPDTPMKLAYYVHNGGVRQSWDPITVFLAGAGTGGVFRLSQNGTVTVGADGVTAFAPSKDGRHKYLLNDFDAEQAGLVLEEYMKP